MPVHCKPHARGTDVRRFPFWAAFLFIVLPNAVASYYNYAFNDQALFRDNELRRGVFQTTAAAVNGVAFPVGIGIFIWLALPVARGIRRLRAGEALGDEESGRMRRQCLEMGHRAALLGTGLWAIAGPFYPLALLVNGQSMNAFESVFFVVSLALGGLIGAAYPFFVVTFLWVRVLYPMLLRPGSATPDDLATLGRGDARTWRYLLLTASVPGLVVALAIVALGEHTAEMRAHFSVLVLGSLAGLRAVFWLCSAIQSDIGILKQAVTMSSVASSGAGRSG